MRRGRVILGKLLRPPKIILRAVPPASFAALIYVFAAGRTESGLAYPIFFLSAYSLTVWLANLPRLARRAKAAAVNSGPVQKVLASRLGKRYLMDTAFRGGVSIYRGMAANFAYALFRAAVGVRCRSVWFVSLAVYDLALGCMRAYLAFCFRRRESCGLSYESRCCRRTAWLLFLLNVPMGGVIVLMVRTSSGFTYPGYVIYLSALYTFYAAILSVVHLVKYRKADSPVLSAAKVLNFVSAMMSVLGLQTALISRFSNGGEAYRKRMNAITGGVVYGTVILLAAYMLLRDAAVRRRRGAHEQS